MFNKKRTVAMPPTTNKSDNNALIKPNQHSVDGRVSQFHLRNEPSNQDFLIGDRL